MQSYSSPEVAATYCKPENWNVFGPEMENHQKNGAGNQIILDYVSRLYRFPRDFSALSYLSQLNQAYCMKVGVEHFRRSMPRTMGRTLLATERLLAGCFVEQPRVRRAMEGASL